jgi:hypothetical protein
VLLNVCLLICVFSDSAQERGAFAPKKPHSG